jgi:hypothetical protein
MLLEHAMLTPDAVTGSDTVCTSDMVDVAASSEYSSRKTGHIVVTPCAHADVPSPWRATT